MNMERLLLTGWSGFIGSHLADLVSQDNNYQLRQFQGDIRSREDIVRNLRDIDTVVHLAALTYLPPSWDSLNNYMEVNYCGTLNLLENHKKFTKFVYISSCYVYGNQPTFPITIDSKPLPDDPYSVAKLAAEQAVKLFSEKYRFDSLIIRPFNNFGPRQSRHYVIPTMILEAVKRNSVTIRVNTEREFIYVKDNVRAIKGFIDNDISGLVQVCKGETYFITDIGKMILRTLQLDESFVEVIPTDRPFHIQKLHGSPKSLLKALPGFRFTPMKDAISDTVQYYRNGSGSPGRG